MAGEFIVGNTYELEDNLVRVVATFKGNGTGYGKKANGDSSSTIFMSNPMFWKDITEKPKTFGEGGEEEEKVEEEEEDDFIVGNLYTNIYSEGAAFYQGKSEGIGTSGGKYLMTNIKAWKDVTEGSKESSEGQKTLAAMQQPSNIRQFDTGANRNSDEGKLDFEGFLSPLVLEAYAVYMNSNRSLENGDVRASDNWQKGIPKDAYMKSMWRHFFDVWKDHRGLETKEDEITNLCGLLFNVSGMLYEKLKEK
jgi:hypothetical protein